MSDYIIIKKSVLPDYLNNVLKAKKMLESNQVKTIKEACEKCNISRSSYYKYATYIFETSDKNKGHLAEINFIILDKPGSLNRIITCLQDFNANIISIYQAMPLNNYANIQITLDTKNLNIDIGTLIDELKKIEVCKKADLALIE